MDKVIITLIVVSLCFVSFVVGAKLMTSAMDTRCKDSLTFMVGEVKYTCLPTEK